MRAMLEATDISVIFTPEMSFKTMSIFQVSASSLSFAVGNSGALQPNV